MCHSSIDCPLEPDDTPAPSAEAHRIAAAARRERPVRNGPIGAVNAQHIMALETNVLYVEDLADAACRIADNQRSEMRRFQRMVGSQLQARHIERAKLQAEITALRRRAGVSATRATDPRHNAAKRAKAAADER